MIKLVLAMLAGMLRGLVRRLTRGATQPSWSWLFDLLISGQRAMLTRMAALEGPALRRVSSGGAAPSKAVAALGFERVDAPVKGAWIRVPAPRGTLLFLHGGGYVVGSVDSHRDFAGRLALAGGFDVFLLEYRLAPEHPHPAALDDALAAWRWLCSGAGGAPERMAIAGDSAGGGLTAALLVALRDAGEPLPAAAGLVCPWVDLTMSMPSIDTNAPTDMLSRGPLEIWARGYAGPYERSHPAISPIGADLANLPPLLVQVGEAEILRDEGVALAQRAEAAGVDVELSLWPEMPHDWHMLAGIEPRGQQALEALAEHLADHMKPV